jgi:hypothetical protein
MVSPVAIRVLAERTSQQATMAVEARNAISRKPRLTAWAARRLLGVWVLA